MNNAINYPADTVDSTGKVWSTVGENIRHGNKKINYFGMEWKTARLMIHDGVLTQSGISTATIGGTEKNEIYFGSSKIAIIGLISTITEASPDASYKGSPEVGVGLNGYAFINLKTSNYKTILLEFQYREIA